MSTATSIAWTEILCTTQARLQLHWSLTDSGGLGIGSWR
jgi:hypothetical protein